MNTLIKPADLDHSILHSPDAVRRWKQECADYHQAIRAIEQAKVAKAAALFAYQNRLLNEDEYFQLKVKEKAANDAKIAERAAAEKAAALAEIDRLMQSPPTVEVTHRNEYSFLKEVIHFANRGYTMNEDGFLNFGMGHYHILLTAPTVVKKEKKCV